MVADRKGTSTGFALDNLQKRGELFIGAGEETYEGMIIGEASRPDEMVVNPARPKQLTDIRTHASDEAINLRPPREMTLETAIEWIANDELVEVTPSSIRVRKRFLSEPERRRLGKKSVSTVSGSPPPRLRRHSPPLTSFAGGEMCRSRPWGRKCSLGREGLALWQNRGGM